MSGPYDDTLSIGELSHRTGSSVRALRYYEQHGLLRAVRTQARHRRFDESAVETVRRIRLLLDSGLPLAIVAKIMPCFTDDGARMDACVVGYLRDHLSAVHERIAQLDRQRDRLEQLERLVGA